MIKKILITLLTIANLFSVAASAATEEVDIMQNDVSFVSADYGDLNILTVKDGKKIAVNGGFAFSFYSSSAVTAQMEISMVGLTSGRQALVFFNQTEEGEKITSANAPAMTTAVNKGAIPVTTTADVYNLTSEDFSTYTYTVNVKEGVNTVYVPTSNLSNDCCSDVYQVGDVTCNNGVCYESISFTAPNWDGYKIYVVDIPTQYLTAHDNGQILEGYDPNDSKTDRTVAQSYPSMYTVVPFNVSEAGDYIVNVNYNAWTYSDVHTTYPAAVFVDANISSIANDEWKKFLDESTYPSSTWHETTDAQLKTITNNGALKPVDIGYWRSGLPTTVDGSYPFYYVKSFKLSNLSAGAHTLLFYTAENMLDTVDGVVNENVFFNSFEFIRIKDDTSSMDISVQKVVNNSTDRISKVPATYAEAMAFYNNNEDTLCVPVTVSNHTTTKETGTVFVALYKDNRVVNVKTSAFALDPHASHEENIYIPITADADTVSVYIWEDGTLKPYIKGISLLN